MHHQKDQSAVQKDKTTLVKIIVLEQTLEKGTDRLVCSLTKTKHITKKCYLHNFAQT